MPRRVVSRTVVVNWGLVSSILKPTTGRVESISFNSAIASFTSKSILCQVDLETNLQIFFNFPQCLDEMLYLLVYDVILKSK